MPIYLSIRNGCSYFPLHIYSSLLVYICLSLATRKETTVFLFHNAKLKQIMRTKNTLINQVEIKIMENNHYHLAEPFINPSLHSQKNIKNKKQIIKALLTLMQQRHKDFSNDIETSYHIIELLKYLNE